MEKTQVKTLVKACFPVRENSVDHPSSRLAGLYPQVQEGYWLQRVRIAGGVLTAEQWRALADLAGRYTPQTPLHLTTRQDVEIHDLRAEQIPALQADLAVAGLTGLGACGDTLRNITVCPCAGVVTGSMDLHPLAVRLQEQLQAYEGVFSLPRKFKIALSCCQEAKAQPWINDLGFTVCRRDQAWGLRVTVGGSLGAKPGTAMVWREMLDPQEAPACALAALIVFDRHGNRQQRYRARLRHVREQLGDEKFLELLEETFREVHVGMNFAPVDFPQTAQGRDHLAVLTFPNGDVTPAEAEALAGLIDQHHTVRIGNHHRVLVFSPTADAVGTLQRDAVLKAKAQSQPTVVACPGRRWCKHGLTDTHRLADVIRKTFRNQLPPTSTVAISGCPHGCAQSIVADIGLIGQLTGQKGQSHQAYAVWIGGGGGQTGQLGQQVKAKLRVDEVLDFLQESLTTTF